MQSIQTILEIFSRAGGGGSGGAGGGGGGGGGGGAEAFALVGYFPSYLLGRLVKKLFPHKMELITGIVTASVASLIFIVLAINSGSFAFSYISFWIIVGIWAGWGSAFFSVAERLKKRAEKAKGVLSSAAQKDAAWNSDALIQRAKQVFMQYQSDWSTLNTQNLLSYATPAYANKSYLLMRCLAELDRKNLLTNIVISDILIIDAADSQNDSEDTFTVAVTASMRDELIQASTNTSLFTTKSSFREYWRFVRQGDVWLLDSIEQETASILRKNSGLQQLAQQHGMHYSLDMGWLFMPAKGILVKKGNFGVSDINNHIVGLHNNLLVQLFTFAADGTDPTANSYVVVQINLPKYYGGILVRPKAGMLRRGLFDGMPNNYNKYSFEWQDFNDRYEVFATDADRLASFELINPGFMAFLYDNDPKATIEVADNTVYIYKPSFTLEERDYQTFMTILSKSFKELQL